MILDEAGVVRVVCDLAAGVRFPLSWSVNPPEPGEPDYPAFVMAMPAERERLRRLAESIVGPERAELLIPDVRAEADFEPDPRPIADQVAAYTGADQ